jgi:hypothetical protein
MDLLEYAQQLVARGQTNTQTQSHTAYLQELVKSESPTKVEIKASENKKQVNNNQIQPKSRNTNLYLLIGGLTLLLGSVLAIGYWLGKRKQSKNKL